ncbi:hypothetical protein [Streptomyces macrosporus]|uniref:HNH endonuclease n=1 Tax=Streptomyces macrosporus TaxID=44032 RepID=A0ABN3KE52_9ACTN
MTGTPWLGGLHIRPNTTDYLCAACLHHERHTGSDAAARAAEARIKHRTECPHTTTARTA